MKTSCIIVCLLSLCCASSLKAQFFYPFEKLEVQDTIWEEKKINALREGAVYLKDNYFIRSGDYFGNGVALYKKQKNYWLALNLPWDNQQREISEIKFNGRYLYYETSFSHAARGIVGNYSYFNIIDPDKQSRVEFQSRYYLEQWNSDDENAIPEKTSCSVKIVLDTAEVQMFASQLYSECNIGLFKITDSGLTKIKRYDDINYRMVPVKWVGKIATGMTLEEFSSLYENTQLEKAPNIYGNCAEDERDGYKVSRDETPILYFIMDQDELHISGIIILSPEFYFRNIHCGMTAGEVLKNYPEARLRKDLLSEQEFLFIEELGIDLVFNTTEENRVGLYRYDRKLSDEVYKKLVRKDAVVDWIMLK